MAVVDRWLLPDGIEELLPDEALRVERLRRRVLDLYDSWGYDLVVPPLVEFTESLLSGVGADLDLLTFKVTDQVSGRMMGIRADVTPQTTRMDAHSFRRTGPNRLCYAATVLYSRQRTPLESRSPIQTGVELYGEASLAADIEVISLLLETLKLCEAPAAHLDLGHVGIYRSLLEVADLSREQEQALFNLLQGKAVTELDAWLSQNLSEQETANWFRKLADLSGDESVLDRAKDIFADAPAKVDVALAELKAVVEAVKAQYGATDIYLDLGELRGFHYHTGIVFSAHVPGTTTGLGNGGRYDHVGEGFGRSRPATGFSVNLKALALLAKDLDVSKAGIFAPSVDDPNQHQAVDALRAQGERVVSGFAGQEPDYSELNCDRVLTLVENEYRVEPV